MLLKKLFEGVLYQSPLPALPTEPLIPYEPKVMTFKQKEKKKPEIISIVSEPKEVKIASPKIIKDEWILKLKQAPNEEKIKTLAEIPTYYYSDYDIMLEASMHIHGVLKIADPALRDNYNFMKEAYCINPENLQYASDEVKQRLEHEYAILEGIAEIGKKLGIVNQ